MGLRKVKGREGGLEEGMGEGGMKDFFLLHGKEGRKGRKKEASVARSVGPSPISSAQGRDC